MGMSDLILSTTGGATVTDGLASFYGKTATESLDDAVARWLISQGATPAPTHDMWREKFGTAGAFNDRIYAFWDNNGVFGPPINEDVTTLVDEFGNILVNEFGDTLIVYNGPEGSPIYDVTSLGGEVNEGGLFTLGDFGDLTGVTSVTIDGVACTSVVVAGDNLSLSAVAPDDGVRYGESVAIRTA